MSDFANLSWDNATPRTRVDINHHFHWVTPSKLRDFGILKISKSASTSLGTFTPFNLDNNHRVHLNDFQGEDVFACIRSPVQRFISSIPETLRRYSTRHQSKPRYKSAVFVSSDVAYRLDQLVRIEDTSRLLADYLEIVEEGFFDAHHQPQIDFFTRSDSSLFRPVSVFSLDNIDMAVSKICSIYRLPSLGYQVGNKNMRNMGTQSSFLRTILGKTYRSIFNPLPVNCWTTSRRSFVELHRRLMVDVTRKPEMQCKIRNIYQRDVELYNILIKTRSTFLRLIEGTL